MDLNYQPIEEEFDFNSNYSSVVERYYTRRYATNVTTTGDDYCVLIHSNRVCVVSVAPTHLMNKSKVVIKSVDFQIGPCINRLQNNVSGKWKHGAQKLKPFSPILVVKCFGDTEFTLYSGISGKLLEVNQQLLEDPQLLLTDPDGRGYMAIILPDISVAQDYKESLLSEEEFRKKHSTLRKVIDPRRWLLFPDNDNLLNF